MRPFLLTLLLLTLAILPLRVQAAPLVRSAPTVTRNEVHVDFPNSVTFHLELADPSAISRAVLVYSTRRFACLDVAGRVPIELSGNSLEWQWVMTRSGNPPPGAELWWQWELTLADGQTFTTPRQTMIISDDRFNWRVVSEAGIHLHWYAGEDVGPILLAAAVAGRQTLEEEMGIALQADVRFYIYGSSQEMRRAVLYIQDWAGGVAFSEYNVILIGVPPRSVADWGTRTVRHELAHLALAQFGQSCVGGRRPTWLEEGVAMVAEGAPSNRVRTDLQTAVHNDAFMPLRSLVGAFPAHDAAASLAYSQSYSVVNFLLAAYGREALQALILRLAAGEGDDEALTAVYGFNMDGLESSWRASLGLPPRQIPPTPTPLTAALIPTIAPSGLPQSVPTPPAAAALPPEVPVATPAICGLGLIPLILLAGASKRKTKSTRQPV